MRDEVHSGDYRAVNFGNPSTVDKAGIPLKMGTTAVSACISSHRIVAVKSALPCGSEGNLLCAAVTLCLSSFYLAA